MTSIRLATSGLALALFAGVLVSPLVASAQGVTKTKTEQCRLIKAKSEREACYTRQEAELAKNKAATAAKPDAVDVDRLKVENDRLTNRLKGICRGC